MLWSDAGEVVRQETDVLIDVDLVLQVGEIGSEEALGRLTIWAVGLGENDDFVARDGVFDDLLSRHACYGRGGCDTGEESPNSAAIYTVEHRAG